MENMIVKETTLDDEIDLFELFQVLIKHKYLITGVSIIIAFGAFLFTSLKPKTYTLEMIVQPGILRIGEQGINVYIDTVDNIRALIESGSFNYEILKILKNKYGENSLESLDFKVEIPKGSNTLKIIFETDDIDLGLEAENLLYKFLDSKYLSIVNYYKNEIDDSDILNKLDLKEQEFVLVTAHRAENVDNFESLNNIIEALNYISKQFKIVVSLHPRTKSKIEKFGIKVDNNILLSDPLGFFDFVKLEKTAKCVITDSGTCQEETSLFNVPSIIIRDSTERQELIECGSTVLVGTNRDQIIGTFNVLINRSYEWTPPEDYLVENVSDMVINVLLGKI